MNALKAQIKFTSYIMRHPLAGFWEMKREKKGRLWFSWLIMALVIFTNIFSLQATSFLFNEKYFSVINIGKEIMTVLIVYVVFCVANWSITTLMDGEGSMKDIFMTVGYACAPLFILRFPAIIISNICTFSEGVYINAVMIIAVVWSCWLLFTGLMTVHQYSIGKMLFMLVITVIAMLAIIFLYMLFLSLFSQMAGFVYSIYKEITLRR